MLNKSIIAVGLGVVFSLALPSYADKPRGGEPATSVPSAQEPAQAPDPAPDLQRPVDTEASAGHPLTEPLPGMAKIVAPREFVAEYDARVSAARGEATMTVRAINDDTFLFHAETRARGLARLLKSEPITECSLFGIDEDGQWLPQRYHFRDDDKDNDIFFDWQAGVANTRLRGESGSLTLSAGATDRLLEQLKVSRLVTDGEPIGELTVIDRAQANTIRYEALGAQRISVKAGSFDTLLFRRVRDGSKRSSLIWLAPALDGLPVRIEQYRLEDRRAVIELDSYQDEKALQARGTVTPVCP